MPIFCGRLSSAVRGSHSADPSADPVLRPRLTGMALIDKKSPQEVSTATTTAFGLVGGYLTAVQTGIRPLGGVILGSAGYWAARSWAAKTTPATTAGLLGGYIAAFGLSHPLAKKIGSWPAVGVVTAATAGAAYALSDRK